MILFFVVMTYVSCKVKGHILKRFTIMMIIFALVFTARFILDLLRSLYLGQTELSDEYKASLGVIRLLRDIFSNMQWFGILR